MRRPRPLHGRLGRGGAGGRQGTHCARNCVHGVDSRIFRLSGSIEGGKGPGEEAGTGRGWSIDEGESCSDGMRAVWATWGPSSPD